MPPLGMKASKGKETTKVSVGSELRPNWWN